MKLSLEQVYASKSEMETRENKQRYEQRLEALDKQHKEELNRLSSAQDKIETGASLTEQYNQLVKVGTDTGFVLSTSDNLINNKSQHCQNTCHLIYSIESDMEN